MWNPVKKQTNTTESHEKETLCNQEYIYLCPTASPHLNVFGINWYILFSFFLKHWFKHHVGTRPSSAPAMDTIKTVSILNQEATLYLWLIPVFFFLSIVSFNDQRYLKMISVIQRASRHNIIRVYLAQSVVVDVSVQKVTTRGQQTKQFHINGM